MAGAVANPHQFGPDVGPESLTLLDNNFNPLFTAVNTLSNFDNYYVDSGAANAMIVTVASPQIVSAYVDGLMIQVMVAATNTSTAVTCAINALGAKAVVMPDGSLPQVGSIVAGAIVQLQYSATMGKFQLAGGIPGTGPFPAGTAAAPSITFSGNLATGFFLAAANALGMSTAGVQRLLMSAAGALSLWGPNAGALIDATVDSGSFSSTSSGSWVATITWKWRRIGGMAFLYTDTTTSTATALASALNWNNLPAAITPAAARLVICGTGTLEYSSGTLSVPGGLLLCTVNTNNTFSFGGCYLPNSAYSNAMAMRTTTIYNAGNASLDAGCTVVYPI